MARAPSTPAKKNAGRPLDNSPAKLLPLSTTALGALNVATESLAGIDKLAPEAAADAMVAAFKSALPAFSFEDADLLCASARGKDLLCTAVQTLQGTFDAKIFGITMKIEKARAVRGVLKSEPLKREALTRALDRLLADFRVEWPITRPQLLAQAQAAAKAGG